METVNDNCGKSSNAYSYEVLEETAKFLLDRVPYKPKVGIVCGSGLGAMADSVKNPITFPYEDIPNFPVTTVKGHTGQLIFGYVNDVPVVCMQGRLHVFEGYSLSKCTMPVRVMKLLGITHLILSNAAGALNKTYKVGDVMIIKDHINMLGLGGNNPLSGPNEERFGPRFPSMTNAYDKELIKAAKKIAVEEGIGDIVHDGVFICVGGPSFETVAELNMAYNMGCDTVGMSTAPEVVVARHCNLTVFAFSLITNLCAHNEDCQEEVDHEKVLNAAKSREKVLTDFVSKVITYINNNTPSGK